MDELPIGRRVAYWRGRRKMSQQVFADRLGKSKSWVDKVERGVRRLDKFSVVYEIADVLQVDVQLLLGKDVERRPETQNCIDQVEVEEIRAALERYDQMSAFFHPVPVAPPLIEMRKAVSHAWLTYQHAKYGVLARALPTLREIVMTHVGGRVLVVSHKATIRLLLSSLLGFDTRGYRDRLDQDPACLNVLDFRDPVRVRLILFNDTSHYTTQLPVTQQSLSKWWDRTEVEKSKSREVQK